LSEKGDGAVSTRCLPISKKTQKRMSEKRDIFKKAREKKNLATRTKKIRRKTFKKKWKREGTGFVRPVNPPREISENTTKRGKVYHILLHRNWEGGNFVRGGEIGGELQNPGKTGEKKGPRLMEVNSSTGGGGRIEKSIQKKTTRGEGTQMGQGNQKRRDSTGKGVVGALGMS